RGMSRTWAENIIALLSLHDVATERRGHGAERVHGAPASSRATAIGPEIECEISSALTPCCNNRLTRIAVVLACCCTADPACPQSRKISAKRPSSYRVAVAR